MTEVPLAALVALNILGGAGLVKWLRKQIKALQGNIKALEGTAAAQKST